MLNSNISSTTQEEPKFPTTSPKHKSNYSNEAITVAYRAINAIKQEGKMSTITVQHLYSIMYIIECLKLCKTSYIFELNERISIKNSEKFFKDIENYSVNEANSEIGKSERELVPNNSELSQVETMKIHRNLKNKANVLKNFIEKFSNELEEVAETVWFIKEYEIHSVKEIHLLLNKVKPKRYWSFKRVEQYFKYYKEWVDRQTIEKSQSKANQTS